jgi:gas vesicle protein
MNSSKILVVLLAGAAAGAAIGLLSSSGSGRKMIRNVKSKREKYSESVKENVVNLLFRLIDKITAEREMQRAQ